VAIVSACPVFGKGNALMSRVQWSRKLKFIVGVLALT
jgi:hypothetical protein